MDRHGLREHGLSLQVIEARTTPLQVVSGN